MAGEGCSGQGLPVPNRSENRNILKLPKIQSCFSSAALHVTEVPWSSFHPDFAVCYHNFIKSNATGNGNRYSLPDGSFSKVFQEAEGEGLPQLKFTGILTGRKVSMLKKDGFLIRICFPGPSVLSCPVFITLVTFLRLGSSHGCFGGTEQDATALLKSFHLNSKSWQKSAGEMPPQMAGGGRGG